MSFGTPPTIPAALQVYNSYVIDPEWQRKFTVIWGSCLGVALFFALPRLFKAIYTGRAFAGLGGIKEDWKEKYDIVSTPKSRLKPKSNSRTRNKVEGVLSVIRSFTLWTLPGIELNAGQIFVVLAYLIIVLICITSGAQLVNNSNRAGFMALAQLPVVFLFATKNSLVSLLLGPGGAGYGYEKLNYIHRWSARCLILGALVHGSLWIRNHLQYDIPIIGAQKETSGVAALGVLCGLALTSIGPLRKRFWRFFWVVHVLGFVAFFITICYHTIYAPPWIFPPLGFYALDIFLRMIRVRFKDATLTAVDQNMTLVHIPDCDSNWRAGQHVRLRVFFSGRVLESHPFTIMTAPSSVTCQNGPQGRRSGIILGTRVAGDWTRALNQYAVREGRILLEQEQAKAKGSLVSEKKTLPDDDASSLDLDNQDHPHPPVPALVSLDGPYGGCSLDLGNYSTVLLIAGGSGATFTIGLLDDIVGRCLRLGRSRGERTRRIEFVWCMKSFGHLNWFAPMLGTIAKLVQKHKDRAEEKSGEGTGSEELTLDLHISVYVTCLCNPQLLPQIPYMDVLLLARRPHVGRLLGDLVREPRDCYCNSQGIKECTCMEQRCATGEDEEAGRHLPCDPESCPASSSAIPSTFGDGIAICVSGPASLTREASNAAARLSLSRGVEIGGVGLHTEVFSV